MLNKPPTNIGELSKQFNEKKYFDEFKVMHVERTPARCLTTPP
jgi:hypothetical protein